MRNDDTWLNFKLDLLSLWLLFFLIIVVIADLPLCFGKGCAFKSYPRLPRSPGLRLYRSATVNAPMASHPKTPATTKAVE